MASMSQKSTWSTLKGFLDKMKYVIYSTASLKKSYSHFQQEEHFYQIWRSELCQNKNVLAMGEIVSIALHHCQTYVNYHGDVTSLIGKRKLPA